MAHAIEGLYAENSNPLIALIAEEGHPRTRVSVAAAVARARRHAGAREALYGAWLCGTVLGATSMALHHKLCHVLGGTFDLRMPKHTPSCCHTRSRTTRRLLRLRWRASRAHSTPTTCRRGCSTSFVTVELRSRFERWVFRLTRSNVRPTGAPEPILESSPAGTRRHPRAARRCVARQASGEHDAHMRDFNEFTSTAAVLERNANCRDERLRQIMTSLVTHLHAIVKEVEPTFEEWAFAIDFLTRTGQICDDKRQEFILLSDTLGVSMLVDAINHRRNSAATESTGAGAVSRRRRTELQMGDSISLDGKGEPLYMSGERVERGRRFRIEGACSTSGRRRTTASTTCRIRVQPRMNLRGQVSDGQRRTLISSGSVKPAVISDPKRRNRGTMLAALGRHPMRTRARPLHRLRAGLSGRHDARVRGR
jgi:catechol 1,2-dioxygenase